LKKELFRKNTYKLIPYQTLTKMHHNYTDQPGNVFGDMEFRSFSIHYETGTVLFLNNVRHEVMEFIETFTS
jgi:hypothetical protein